MKKQLLFLTCLLTSVLVYPQITFERTYGAVNTDIGKSVKQTIDSGYIIAGSTWNFGAVNGDVFLIKTNSIGDTLFCRAYGETDSDIAYCVAQTFDNGYIIVGSTSSFGIVGFDAYLIKTNENGDTLWTKTINSEVYDYGLSIYQTIDSGYIITGQRYNNNGSNHDVILIKTDSEGNTEWIKVFDWTSNEIGNSVIQTKDSGYIIVGMTKTISNGYDFFLLKTNSNGDSLWLKTYGGINTDIAHSVIEASSGGYVIVGTKNVNLSNSDVYIIKTNITGDTICTKSFGGVYNENGYSIAETSDSGLIILGTTYSYGHGYSDVYLIKATVNGDTIWTRTFGGNNFEEGYCVSTTADYGSVIVGTTTSFSAGGNDIYLIKTDSNGISNGSLGINNHLLSIDRIINIYPNPTTGQVYIQILKQFGQTKTLEVFDYTGQLQFRKTDNFSNIDISSLTSGLYFILLTNLDNEKMTSKIIKM